MVGRHDMHDDAKARLGIRYAGLLDYIDSVNDNLAVLDVSIIAHGKQYT